MGRPKFFKAGPKGERLWEGFKSGQEQISGGLSRGGVGANVVHRNGKAQLVFFSCPADNFDIGFPVEGTILK